MINEMLAVAKSLGWDLTSEVDPAAALPARPGRPGGKPSMLQDAEAGRPMEVEAIVGQLQAFGREQGVRRRPSTSCCRCSGRSTRR